MIEALVIVRSAVIDDEDGEIGAPDSVIAVSEFVSDQPEVSASNVTEEEAIVVVGPAVIDDDEGEIDAPEAVVCNGCSWSCRD